MKSCLTILFVLIGFVLKAQVVDRELTAVSGSLQLEKVVRVDTVKFHRHCNPTCSIKKMPLVILDSKRIPFNKISKIDVNIVSAVSVVKDKEARRKYGRRGRHGVIIITTKPS